MTSQLHPDRDRIDQAELAPIYCGFCFASGVGTKLLIESFTNEKVSPISAASCMGTKLTADTMEKLGSTLAALRIR